MESDPILSFVLFTEIQMILFQFARVAAATVHTHTKFKQKKNRDKKALSHSARPL